LAAWVSNCKSFENVALRIELKRAVRGTIHRMIHQQAPDTHELYRPLHDYQE
jgi:hypothetical protein